MYIVCINMIHCWLNVPAYAVNLVIMQPVPDYYKFLGFLKAVVQ